MAAQYLTTSRLNNIVNMIMLGRQSGVLRVVRGHGAAREYGQIRFLDGEPVAALFGELTGANALNVLLNWGECVYAFDEITGGDEPPTGRLSPSAGPSSGSWPSYGYGPPTSYPSGFPPSTSPTGPFTPPTPPSPPPNGPSTAASLPSLDPRSGYTPGYTQPAMPGRMPNGANGANLNSLPGFNGAGASGFGRDGYSGPDSSGYGAMAEPSGAGYGRASPSGRLTPQQFAAVPYRTSIAEFPDQLPLDRRERMTLLLVDGLRSISDLARLTRRNEHDLYAVLSHLASLGLIKYR